MSSDEPIDDVLSPRRKRRSLPVVGQRAPVGALSPSREKDRAFQPMYAVWEVTTACDQSCRHCGSRSGHRSTDELSTDESIDLVAQLAELGVIEVTLIGGEAYLREDFLQIAAAITGHHMACSITTGGRGIDGALAVEMARVGIRTASVSLDGDEATHDRLRDLRGSHAAALRAIDHLRDAGIRPAVNTQVNRLTLPVLDAVVDQLIDHGVKRWMPIMTVPMGRAADEPKLLLQPYDLLRVFPALAALKRRADDAGILFAPSNNVGYFGPYEHVLRGHFRAGYGGSCGAGKITLGIEADGSIKGCPGLPSAAYVGGSVRTHRLRDIWERAAALRYTRDRTRDDLWGFCRTCYYADECMAGCTWTSHVFFGRPGNNPYCHHRALELSRFGKRERLVPIEEPSGRPFDHGVFRVLMEDVSADGEADPPRAKS